MADGVKFDGSFPIKEEDKKKNFWTINHELLPYKLHFFLFFAAMSCCLPYRTIFTMEKLNMSSTNIATMVTTQQFIVVITKPIIGAIVDYLNKLKAVIIALTVLQTIFYLSTLWIPVNVKHSTDVWFNETEKSLTLLTLSTNETLDDWSVTEQPLKTPGTPFTYWIIVICYVCGGVCSNALFTLSDTACYESLQRTGAEYGKQRLWGAVSWGLFAPFAGYLNDVATGNSKTHDYSTGFYLMAAISVLLIFNIARMDLVKPDLSGNILKDIKLVFSSREFVVFECGVFMTGIFTGCIWFYLMIYLEALGATQLLLGLVHTCQCFLGEAPLMFASGWIVKKIGHINVLALTLTTFFVRFICYSYLINPWHIFPVEMTHGLTYAVFYAAMTAYGKLSARPGTEATTQAVLCITYEGFGAGLGSVLAGVGFDRLGNRETFFYGSIASLAAAALYILLTLSLKSRRKTVIVKQPNISTISRGK